MNSPEEPRADQPEDTPESPQPEVSSAAPNSPEQPEQPEALGTRRAELASERAASESKFSGSPFAHGTYSGVGDSIARERAKVMSEDKRRAKNLGVFVTAALLVGGLLGGTAGGAFAIWNLSSRGLVTEGVTAPTTITVNAPLEASEITALAGATMALQQLCLWAYCRR